MNINEFNGVRNKLISDSKDLRKKLFEIVDDNSFVELNAYSFAKNEFFNADENSLGVITGYATINGDSVFVVAQNGAVLNGGVSKANCEKIVACLNKAIKSNTPVVYLLDTQGVQVGEGVGVLESMASVLAKANELKGVVPQFAIASGDVYGSFALLFSVADYTYVVGNNCVSYASAQVIAGSSKTPITKEFIGGAKSKNGTISFAVKGLEEVKTSITKIFETIPSISGLIAETEDDFNRNTKSLNEKQCAKCLIDAIYDKNTYIELNASLSEEVKTGIGRIGGISTASIIFDGGKDGVELTLENVLKIKNFANYVANMDIPLVTLVNTKGISKDISVASSPIMQEVMNMLYSLSGLSRISVVYGKAVGFGYTAFASKEFGNEYTYAFNDAKLSLLDGDAGVAVEFGTINAEKIDELKEKYLLSQDAINSAKIGCVDNIIEPQYVRQYIISALEMLIG